jgi:hypothetical protein
VPDETPGKATEKLMKQMIYRKFTGLKGGFITLFSQVDLDVP